MGGCLCDNFSWDVYVLCGGECYQMCLIRGLEWYVNVERCHECLANAGNKIWNDNIIKYNKEKKRGVKHNKNQRPSISNNHNIFVNMKIKS